MRILTAALLTALFATPAAAFQFPSSDAMFPEWEKLCRIGDDMRPECQQLALTGYSIGAATTDVACDWKEFWKQVDDDRNLFDFAAQSRWPEAVGAFIHTPGVCWVRS